MPRRAPAAAVVQLRQQDWEAADMEPAVVIAQSANAFACRSSTLSPTALGWTSNRLLLWAVGFELAIALALIYVGPIARTLGQDSPPLAGWLVAVTGAAAVLAVDRLDKQLRISRRTVVSTAWSPARR